MAKRLTTEEFIQKARKVHEDLYDYSLVDYKNNRTKVEIICKEHGIFEQIPYNHLGLSDCPKCSDKTLTTEEFIKKARKVHGDLYGYSLVDYKDFHTNVKIICKRHGTFEQLPSNHLYKKGCLICGFNRRVLKRKSTTEEFIQKAKKVHEDLYDYSLVDYKNKYTKVKIICKKHGIFEQTPGHHLSGKGCPTCKTSKGELKIRKYFEKNDIKYETQKTFEDCLDKRKLRFDFYLPDNNILVEYDGMQHFNPVIYWGGQNAYIKRQKRDNIKAEYAKENGIKLLRIPYTEYDRIGEILTEYGII